MIGAVARTKLRETPDFADAKRRLKEEDGDHDRKYDNVKRNDFEQEKVDQKTSLALFLMDCMWPLCFYFAYVYCGNALKHSFSLTSEEIIHQNFIVSLVQILSLLLFVFLCYRIYPLAILRVKLWVSSLIIITCPYWLDHINHASHLLLLQSAIIFFAADAAPATSIFYKYFPVFKRFTYISFTYALSRALTYLITSFGLVYLTESFGNWGILIIMVPVCIGYFIGLRHFEKLEGMVHPPRAKLTNFIN